MSPDGAWTGVKRLSATVTPDPAVAPAAFRLLADSPALEECRLVEANLGGDVGPTMLLSVDGDHDGLADALRDEAGVHRAEVTPLDDRRAVLMLTIRPAEIPLAETVFEAFTRPGLVIELPVVYRDGSVHATFLGEPGALQAVVDAFPDAVTVDVREVGTVVDANPAARLSGRQREAVLAGLELGYYDVPRGATHEEVAGRLGVSPSTASEHLQKAEAKLVRAAMDRDET
jgi:predicted DNA binding protein